jgi:flagellar assembly factor FliW
MMMGTMVSSGIEKGALMSQSLAEMEGVSALRSGVGDIETRFGTITVNYDSPVVIEKGLLGMPDKHIFTVLDFPVKKFSRFKLLQCLEDNGLSFILLPLDLRNDIIEEDDLQEAATDIGIAREHLALYLIVNIYREMNTVRISVNARAPLFVDTRTQRATQSVLRNPAYLVRHALTGESL